MDGVDRSRRGDIRVQERGAHDGSDNISVAVACDRRRVAVGNPEGRHALFSRAQYRLHRIPKALPEADGHEYIFRGQDFNFVLQSSGASHRRLSIEPKRRQSVGQVKGQCSGEV